MPTCSCELCTCLYILYKWVLDKIFFSYIDYNLIASYSRGSTTNSLHVRPSHFKYCYFPTQIKLLITSMQFLWSVNYLSNKMDTFPHSLFPISLYDLLLTFFRGITLFNYFDPKCHATYISNDVSNYLSYHTNDFLLHDTCLFYGYLLQIICLDNIYFPIL